MLMYEKKDASKQKGKSKEQKKKSRDVVQAKYMDGNTGVILGRPPETSTITAAKEKAKKDQEKLPQDRRVKGFTAHHKYPWSSIKLDIEKTSKTIPKSDEAETTLKRLEQFSGQKFPVEYSEFVKEEKARENLYRINEKSIDTWIQETCWVPSNIFIGPLSDQREDDPGHRKPVAEVDAHYKRERRMSDVSEATLKMFHAEGLRGNGIVPAPTGIVSAYNPEEWKKDEMASGTQYYQVGDSYYYNHIFHYQIENLNSNIEKDYKEDSFTLTILTMNDVDDVQLQYIKKEELKKGHKNEGKEEKLQNSGKSEEKLPNKKKWTIIISIDMGYRYKDFELKMKRGQGAYKEIKLKQNELNYILRKELGKGPSGGQQTAL